MYMCYEFLLNINYARHVMIFFLNLDDDGCMNAWMHAWKSWDLICFFFIFHFPLFFFFNLRTRLRD